MDQKKYEELLVICKVMLKDRVPDSILENAADVNAKWALGTKLVGEEKRLYSVTRHFCPIPYLT